MIRRIARPMLGSLFLVSGYDAVKDPAGRAAVAAPFLAKAASLVKLPQDDELLVRINGAAMLAGGALLSAGRLPRFSSAVLAGSLVPTTLAGHAFWEQGDPAVRAQQRVQFLKNVGLLGGLLLGVADKGTSRRARRRAAARRPAAQEAAG